MCDGLGLGELELPDGLGVSDGLFVGVGEDVLCDGLGDPDEVPLPEGVGRGVWAEPAWFSLTAEDTATDPEVQGEWADLATARNVAGAAIAGAGAEPGISKDPDHMNMPLVTKTAVRPASAILTGTAPLQLLTSQQPVPPPWRCHYP